MTRSRAALIYLLPGLLLLAACSALALFLWYPYPFRQLPESGKFSTLLIICPVFIGPALARLVHKPGKSGRALAFDLVVIGLVQLLAMAWGAYTLHLARPSFMVFAVDRFETLSRRDVTHPIINPDFQKTPLSGPLPLYANMPADSEQFQKLLREVMFEGKPDLPFRPEFWSSYADRQHLVLQVARPLSELRQARPAAGADIDALVQNNGGDITKLQFVPGLIGDGSFTVVIDGGTGAIGGYLDTDPWINE